ncbi:helix-turn-helix domain-containing protein [Tepidiphilus margaritifer]|uniref:helix-turn-helix domain-containing protein n=1 Tax=Tepidiphilus margaritifer TaxID=203471 RepID=UPI0003FF071F|nr:helix-turn-helix domain-containing protein [Tepidiphilus margaritifer]
MTQQHAEEPRAVGVQLAHARMQQGRTVAEMAQQLKLLPRQLEALEEGRFEDLPGPVFVRGFVRNYARALGLDPEPLLEMLGEQARDREVVLTPASNAQGVIKVRRFRPWRLIWRYVLPILIVVLIVSAYFDWFRMPPPVDQENAAVLLPPGEPEAGVAEKGEKAALESEGTDERGTSVGSNGETGGAVVPAPAPVAPSAAPTPAAEEEKAEPAVPTLRLSASGRSWVEVRDAKGTVLLSRVLSAGERAEVSSEPPLNVVVGNAPVVEIEFQGHPVDVKHAAKNGVAKLRLQ